jgi:hypothetical protein
VDQFLGSCQTHTNLHRHIIGAAVTRCPVELTV